MYKNFAFQNHRLKQIKILDKNEFIDFLQNYDWGSEFEIKFFPLILNLITANI